MSENVFLLSSLLISFILHKRVDWKSFSLRKLKAWLPHLLVYSVVTEVSEMILIPDVLYAICPPHP